MSRSSLLNSEEDIAFLLELKRDFFIETTDSIENAEQALLKFENNQDELALLDFKRVLHSIKGSAKAVDETEFALVVHQLEDRISGDKNEEFFEINYKFLDVAKEYLALSAAGNPEQAIVSLSKLKLTV